MAVTGGAARVDAPDSALFRKPVAALRQWSEEEVRESIRNRFVTGDWGKAPKEGGSDVSGACPPPPRPSQASTHALDQAASFVAVVSAATEERVPDLCHGAFGCSLWVAWLMCDHRRG